MDTEKYGYIKGELDRYRKQWIYRQIKSQKNQQGNVKDG